jgi:hypothetical protein
MEIRLARHGRHVAIVTIDNPPRLNAVGRFGGETRDFRCIWVHVTVSWTREKCALAGHAVFSRRHRTEK